VLEPSPAANGIKSHSGNMTWDPLPIYESVFP